MTGDLTLGTDKITLDATAGSATFAGDVLSHRMFTTTDAANIYGSVLIRYWVNGLRKHIKVCHTGGQLSLYGDSSGSEAYIGRTGSGSAAFARCCFLLSKSCEVLSYRGRLGTPGISPGGYTEQLFTLTEMLTLVETYI